MQRLGRKPGKMAKDNHNQWESIILGFLIFSHKGAQKSNFSYNLTNLKENYPEAPLRHGDTEAQVKPFWLFLILLFQAGS